MEIDPQVSCSEFYTNFRYAFSRQLTKELIKLYAIKWLEMIRNTKAERK